MHAFVMMASDEKTKITIQIMVCFVGFERGDNRSCRIQARGE